MTSSSKRGLAWARAWEPTPIYWRKSDGENNLWKMKWIRVRKAQYISTCAALVILFLGALQTTDAQTPLTSEQFDSALKACAASQRIGLTADQIDATSRLYAVQGPEGPLSDSAAFLSWLPEDARLEGYRLYVDCITKILLQTAIITPPPVTLTFRVCSGEYERACQQHDTYLYCGVDVGAWASARCTSYKVLRLNTYGGNKCGYSLDAVICTGPK